MKKDNYYLKHDIGASRDENIIYMMSEYGIEGYGLYWLINEYLREQTGCRGSLERIPAISYMLRIDAQKATDFITDCIEKFSLYQSDGEYFWSNRMVDDKQHFDQVRAAYRKNGSNGGRPRNTPPSDSEPDSEPDPEPEPEAYPEDTEIEETTDAAEEQTDGLSEENQTETHGFSENNQAVNQTETGGLENHNQTKSNISKGKVSKINITKPKKTKGKPKTPLPKSVFGEFSNVHLSAEEYQKCLHQQGEVITKQALERLSAFKASNGKKYKSDYAAMQNWVFGAIAKGQKAPDVHVETGTALEFGSLL